MHRLPFTNVYRNLNIKKIRAAQGGPLNRGAPCHGIIGVLVNPALILPYATVMKVTSISYKFAAKTFEVID